MSEDKVARQAGHATHDTPVPRTRASIRPARRQNPPRTSVWRKRTTHPPKNPWSLFSQQPALAGAAIVTIFALVKTYAAAAYSLTTASALLTTAPVTVLLGTLTSYEYEILPLLGLAALCWVVVATRDAGWSIWCIAAASLGLIAILLSPGWYLAITAAAFGTFVGLSLLLRRIVRAIRIHSNGFEFFRRIAAAFFVLAGFSIVFFTIQNLWLPVEVIRLKPPAEYDMVVGSVISSDSNWTTILRATDRGLVRERTDLIAGRTVCHLNGAQPPGQPPILYVFSGQSYLSPNLGCQTIVRDALQRETDLEVACGSLPPVEEYARKPRCR
jgi:hypothetical protein